MIKLLKSVEKQPGISVSMVWSYDYVRGFQPTRKRFYSFVHQNQLDPESVFNIAQPTLLHFEWVPYDVAWKRFDKLVKTPMEFQPSTKQPYLL